MKRLISLLTVISLLLSLAGAALADPVTFTTEYFTLQLPDGWIIDTEDLESESDSSAKCLGFFGESSDKGLVAGVYLVYYEDLKNVALWSSDEDELQAYIEAVLEDYKDEHAESLGIVMAGKIPLILIKGVDKDGEFLYADTMTNGYAIEFQVIHIDDNTDNQYPITAEQIELFKSILSTFQPVT